MGFLTVVGVLAFGYLFGSIRVLSEWERGVAFRLGRFWGVKGPGVSFVPLFLTTMRKISLRTVVIDIPPQDVITRDNVSVKVNAVLYMKVVDPEKSVIAIENYLYATTLLAETTLRAVLGEVELDELLADREKINSILKKVIDQHSEVWGIEVEQVAVKDVALPQEMKRAMSRQAEAERERRAKVIAAQGELQASQTLTEAARVMAQEPGTMQLRYLQTVVEIAAENNSTTIFPLPMELLTPFLAGRKDAASAQVPVLPAVKPEFTLPQITMAEKK